MSYQMQRINRNGTDPFPNPAKVTYNAMVNRPFLEKQKTLGDADCFLRGQVNDAILSIHHGQILLIPRASVTGSRYYNAEDGGSLLSVISSLNRLPKPATNSKTAAAMLAEVIAQFEFGGISANYTEEDGTGQYPKNDLATLHGGGAFILNTGNKTIYPGQDVYWDIPPSTEAALDNTAVGANPNGRDSQKILPWTMPLDEQIQELTAVAWRDNLVPGLELMRNGDLVSFNDGVVDPLNNPIGSPARGSVSSVTFDTCINLMCSLVDLMVTMGPFISALGDAAQYFVHRTGTNKPHITFINNWLTQIQQTPEHVTELVTMRNNIRSMLLQDTEAADIFAGVLVPEGRSDHLMYQLPIGVQLRDLDKGHPLRIMDGMQHDALNTTYRLGRRVHEHYTGRRFCKALSQAAPGEYFDATINSAIC